MDRTLRTIRLFARVMKASLGKIRTAPVSRYQYAEVLMRSRRTQCEPISAERKCLGIAVVKPIHSRTEVDTVYEHEYNVEAVDQAAAKDCNESALTPGTDRRNYLSGRVLELPLVCRVSTLIPISHRGVQHDPTNQERR